MNSFLSQDYFETQTQDDYKNYFEDNNKPNDEYQNYFEIDDNNKNTQDSEFSMAGASQPFYDEDTREQENAFEEDEIEEDLEVLPEFACR